MALPLDLTLISGQAQHSGDEMTRTDAQQSVRGRQYQELRHVPRLWRYLPVASVDPTSDISVTVDNTDVDTHVAGVMWIQSMVNIIIFIF
jgi:hypothetical protein